MIGISDVITLLFGQKRDVGGVIPDVILSENHVDSVTITGHPVEYGAQISDHAFVNPAQLTMRMGWSPSSILLNSVLSGSIFKGLQTLDDVYQRLLDLQSLREPFDVLTRRRAYTNMMIQTLAVTTDADTENALVVEVNLVEVLRVRTVVIAGKAPLEAQAMPGKTGAQENAGTKQPQAPAEKNESAMHGALGKISLPF